MKKTLSAVALLGLVGAVGVAQAAPVAATMVSVGSYSKSATTLSNWTIAAGNTATYTFDSATNNLVISGVYKRVVKVGSTPLMTHTMSGITIGSGAATGASWSCTEGAFGGIVGASICGNYTFGANGVNDSTYTPSAVGATVAIGGDDAALAGGPQALANNYSFMNAATMIGGAAPGFQRWVLNNGTDLFPGAGETGTGLDTGYKFTFDTAVAVVPVPAAVWLFGSALGLMGAMRRRSAV
jgi:hypothetical protein